MEMVIDLQSVTMDVTKDEYALLCDCEIPNAVNERLMKILKDKIKRGEGIIENWSEL
jgi:hypothetical protein